MLALISTHGLTDCSCLDLARVQIVHARAAMRIVHAHTGRGRRNARISIRDDVVVEKLLNRAGHRTTIWFKLRALAWSRRWIDSIPSAG